MKLKKTIKINGIQYNSYNGKAYITMVGDFTPKEYRTLLNISKFDNQKLTLEIEEPILDEAEKRYLRGVIRPFRNEVKSIVKVNAGNDEYICVRLDYDGIPLPYFKKGTMYTGMESDKSYTITELGL